MSYEFLSRHELEARLEIAEARLAAKSLECDRPQKFIRQLAEIDFSPLPVDDQLKLDRILFGKSYYKILPDGGKERINPLLLVTEENNV